VVSNAGAAWPGGMADMTDELFRRSFEINFFSHHAVAQNAVRVMRAQGTGGALLFNVSKQAVNPGKDFGAYGCPKAALLFLSRQYALEHGVDGIRVNAVNADRIRSGILTDDMIATRSKARGLSEGGQGRRRGASLPATSAGTQDHRRRHHCRWRKHRRGLAVNVTSRSRTPNRREGPFLAPP